MKDKVISHKNLPAHLPLFPTMTLYLVMDKFAAPGWLWGAVGLIVILWWIGAVTLVVKQNQVDIFEVKK